MKVMGEVVKNKIKIFANEPISIFLKNLFKLILKIL